MTTTRPPLRIPLPARSDTLALLILAIVCGFSARDLLVSPVRAGLDTVSFFWPTYAFLGDQLRAGKIPGWNPYQFSGVPFAADAESGWMYVPAMLVFGLLQLSIAIKVYAAAHLLLTAAGTYLYARVMGMVSAGALVSAWAITQGGYFTDRGRCCYAHIQVVAWIPVALLGIELALRTSRATLRLAGWTITGIAISQVLSGWIGQGAMYALLLWASYAALRCVNVIFVAGTGASRMGRLRLLAGMLAIPPLIGVGLAMPGVLPRVLYTRITTLANGYTGSAAWAADAGGWSVEGQLRAILTPSGWFIGGSVLILAIVGLVLCRRTPVVAYWAILTVGAFVLGLDHVTPLHQVLFAVIPQFESMHSHFPERIALILIFGPAMLAGFGVTALWTQRAVPKRTAIASLTAVGVGIAALALVGPALPAATWVLALLTLGAITGAAWLGQWGNVSVVRLITVAVVALVLIDLTGAATIANRDGTFLRRDPAEITQPNAAGAFLQARSPIYPVRYIGYDPSISTINNGEITYYRHNFQDERTLSLLVNNQGLLWQIGDAQGYNPLQLQDYVDFIAAINGSSQEYHGSYILAGGLDSPLLSLLALEYLVVPLEIPAGRGDLQDLVHRYPEAMRTEEVRVLRVTDSLPRAWIVHNLVASEIVPSDGSVDFRTTAIIDPGTEDSPLTSPVPAPAAAESARIEAWSPDEVTTMVTASSDGVVILSEPFADGWSATVDGEAAPILRVNGAFRGIPVGPGPHTVRMTYKVPGLEIGFAIGGATLAAVVAGFVFARRWDRRELR